MRAAVEEVRLEGLRADQRQTLEALMQLYLHDFSEHAPLGSPHGEVNEAGRFATPMLEGDWAGDGRAAFLLRADGRLAGFALVNRWSALDLPLDHAVAEFFVLRKYRLAGVGTRAALNLFSSLPGRWEVPVASYNQGAKGFWRRVAGRLPCPVTEREGDGHRWRGIVLCFDNRA